MALIRMVIDETKEAFKFGYKKRNNEKFSSCINQNGSFFIFYSCFSMGKCQPNNVLFMSILCWLCICICNYISYIKRFGYIRNYFMRFLKTFPDCKKCDSTVLHKILSPINCSSYLGYLISLGGNSFATTAEDSTG